MVGFFIFDPLVSTIFFGDSAVVTVVTKNE